MARGVVPLASCGKDQKAREHNRLCFPWIEEGAANTPVVRS
jgi:hypothetical protein